MKWIDLPFDKRPQLILGVCFYRGISCLFPDLPPAAYEPHLDQVGHQAGPYSTLVNVRSHLYLHVPIWTELFFSI